MLSFRTPFVRSGIQLLTGRASNQGWVVKQTAVYILANKRNGTLYTGVTSDLQRRVWQHKRDVVEGFSKRYQTHLLVYFELHSSMYEAISREKKLKKWHRRWKLELIESLNPEWNDLYDSLV